MEKEKKEVNEKVEYTGKKSKFKELKQKVKENKALCVIGRILYDLLFVFIIVILLVVLVQRFSNNNLSLFGYRMFNIVSESMVPKYQIGDILLDKNVDPSQLKVGDDVTYIGKKGDFKDRVVTHKIIGINKEDGTIQTKGIANEFADPTISKDQVYGKVVYKFQTLSVIGKIINNTYGFYILIFIPLSILIALKIREIVVNMRLDEEDAKNDEKNRKERIEEIKKERKNDKKKDEK